MPHGLMQIGELAERAGVSHRTIRYYESLGLLRPVERAGGGYRYYDEGSLKRLDKIGALKRLGLTLDEIREVIGLYFADETGAKGKKRIVEILQQHLRETEERLAQLTAFRDELRNNIERIVGQIDPRPET